MDDLLAWIVIGFVAWWFYKTGERTGSRKGYNVGRSQSRRHHHRRR
ncbi:hypothetical protein RMSM_00797 [Rhodopirellula maiorica SM1]|uniref:Uncharacterized protein n=1 Tax=Rhodopirellula maiorica SM1 TaxID=1265738 RepID=M5RSU0_9BACT|nr:hypothetical protein [Rhodopirellula maiorica]EMI22271.1 hypothetical protein RMSM_00797 [Rhodopirellula maiorica SM1]